MMIIPSQVFDFFKYQEDNYFIRIFWFLINIPILFLWLYNIRFAYKNDKYSKALLFLFIFHIFYSPYYYYQVNFKNRKLKNIMNNEEVLGNKVIIEEYENEEDFKNDLENL